MPDDTSILAVETTAATTPPATSGAIFAKKPASSLTFAERSTLFFKKYQYINGQNLDPVAAEEKAREDLGIEPMTDSEIDMTKKPSFVTRVVDHPMMQSIGASAVIHRTWSTLIEGKKAEAVATVDAKKDEMTHAIDAKKTEALDAANEKKEAVTAAIDDKKEAAVAAVTAKRDEATAAVEAKKAEAVAHVDATKHAIEEKVQSMRDTAAATIVHVAERIAGHEIAPHIDVVPSVDVPAATPAVVSAIDAPAK